MSANEISLRRQALPAIAVGHIIIAVAMVLNGTTGARLHVAFPVLNRSSFGFWFSYFSVISRVVLSMFWFGIQTYTGSESVYQVSGTFLLCRQTCSRKLTMMSVLTIDASCDMAEYRSHEEPSS